MRMMAIDYGLRRLGLAICDPGEVIVSPLSQLVVGKEGRRVLFGKLAEIIEEHEVEAIVVGLPINMDGSEGEQAKLTRRFAESLERELSPPVFLHDERLSSTTADEMMEQAGVTPKKRKTLRDSFAACAILNNFLTTRRATTHHGDENHHHTE